MSSESSPTKTTSKVRRPMSKVERLQRSLNIDMRDKYVLHVHQNENERRTRRKTVTSEYP